MTLSELRNLLAELDRTRSALIYDVTLMNPDERLVYGCRDYEKWAKAYVTAWYRERVKMINAWEDANPMVNDWRDAEYYRRNP